VDVVELLPSVVEAIRGEWKSAANGEKTLLVRKWAEVLGCSPQTLYRVLGVGRRRKKGERKIEGIERAAELVAQIKRRPPEDAGEISTDQALEMALDGGIIAEELGQVSVATYNRLIREKGMCRRAPRVQRFQAMRPNELHHIDASSSKYFYVHRVLPDGDCVLKLMRHVSAQGYKNKPTPVELRPWMYGLTDDYSGYHVARYVAARGESLADNLLFLQWAWAQNEDMEFFGLPAKIKADHGPMMKGESAIDLLARLDIEISPSVPYEKRSHGKIERPWRTHQQRFEKPFYVEADWQHFEILLSELNRRFIIYLEEYNSRQHRYEKEVSRLDMWRRINQWGGAVAIPENILGTVARRRSRKVGVDGVVSVDGKEYEVKGLHDRWVWVYEGVFEDQMVVEDKESGEKYQVKKFAPTPLDTFVGHEHTEHQKAVKAAGTLELKNTLYTEREAAEGNVIRIPTRVKEVRSVENPLDTDSFSSIEAAMREFLSICPLRLDAENREAVRDTIIEHGLSRSYVRELALKIQAEIGQEESYG